MISWHKGSPKPVPTPSGLVEHAGNPRPGVYHFEHAARPRGMPSGNEREVTRPSRLAERLVRIGQEIQYHLEYLVGISPQGGMVSARCWCTVMPSAWSA